MIKKEEEIVIKKEIKEEVDDLPDEKKKEGHKKAKKEKKDNKKVKKNKQTAGPMHFTANNEPRAVDVIGELDPPIFDEVNIILLICIYLDLYIFFYSDFYNGEIYNVHK